MGTTHMFQPEVETMAPEDKHALQSRRLVALLERLARCDRPYWREKLAGVDVSKIRSIDDIGALPFTWKDEFRRTYPFEMLAVPRAELVRVHASSGTSGKPTIVGYTARDVAVFAEVNARAVAMAGGTPSDVVHIAYGYGLFTGGLGLHYGVERLGAAAVPASGGNVGFQLTMLADLQADGIACTPSFALLLGERAREEGLVDRLWVRYGILGAEPWSEGMRRRIEELWGNGFEAVDIYGLSEVMGPGVAMESPAAKGALNVFDDHFYPEIVDPETGEPVPDGELGELVLTTLTKEAQPVLRYRTRDLTRFVTEPSPDGRTFRRIARLEGRVDDMLIVRGVNVYPKAIETVLLEDEAVGGQYGIVVDRRGTMDELRVVAELADAELVP
ncbi:MAG TPA: phenylacetate--CoA ligase, partial [Actinobacteria bacterium]|nr:phenylacetate--CoA ligase [Actinomycetota bacterium]